MDVAPIQIGNVRPKIYADAGQAWVIDFEFNPSVIAHWLILAPNYHRQFNFYFIFLIDLKNELAMKIGKVSPEVTHEINVLSVIPNEPVFYNRSPHLVTPMNFRGQWYAANNDLAKAAVKEAVTEICQGYLDPNISVQDRWIMRFGSAMLEAKDLDVSYVLRKEEIH